VDLSHAVDDSEMTELVDFAPDRVDLVKEGANGIPRFLIAKGAGGRGLVPPDMVRELIGKQAEPAPEDADDGQVTVTGSPAAIAKMIHQAAQRAAASEKVSKDMVVDPELDEGVDGLDPTVPLAAPDEDKPGNPVEPGSPAWEAIDAATARKWTSIAVRLKNALHIMSEREWLEAASGDEDDAESAMDLEDAKGAVEYVIDVLAGFAVTEQAEADLGGEAMETVGKSAAPRPDPAAVTAVRKAMSDGKLPAALTVIETFDAVVAKAGRVLSSVNETHIREAAGRLNTVLAALPQAPTTDDSGQPVAKQEGAAAMADTDTEDTPADVAKDATPDQQARNTGPVHAGGTTGLGLPRDTGPDGALPADGPQAPQPGDVPGRQVIKATAAVGVFDHDRRFLGLTDPAAVLTDIAKADKTPMCVVYNQDGALIGIVDPGDITPVANSEAKPDEAPADADAAEPAAAAEPVPAPPAEVGTPADAVDNDDDTVTKTSAPATGEGDDTPVTVTRGVLKSLAAEMVTAALEALTPAQDVAKQADVAGVSDQLTALEGRLAVVEKHPAAPGVFTNGQLPPDGAVPPPRPSQLRGQDQGAGPQTINVAKALQRKADLYNARDAVEQNERAQSMQGDAIAALHALHAAGPAR
jgi:hypothetical protein